MWVVRCTLYIHVHLLFKLDRILSYICNASSKPPPCQYRVHVRVYTVVKCCMGFVCGKVHLDLSVVVRFIK